MSKSKSVEKKESVQVKPQAPQVIKLKKFHSKLYVQFLATLSSSEREVAKKEPARIATTFKRYVENMEPLELLEIAK